MSITHSAPADYDEKFRDFIRQPATARQRGTGLITVASPQSLGSIYEEVMESLSRPAAAERPLAILLPAGPSSAAQP